MRNWEPSQPSTGGNRSLQGLSGEPQTRGCFPSLSLSFLICKRDSNAYFT